MFFKKNVYETKNEVVINLLPEKAKRDYILRMVAFILFLIFIIINFFTIFLPQLNRVSQINALKRENYRLESEYYNVYEIYSKIPTDHYNIQKNKDYIAVGPNQLDVESLINDVKFNLKLFKYSYLENVSYNTVNHQLTINTQFIKTTDVVDFMNVLIELSYIHSIEIKSNVQINIGNDQGKPRQKVIYTMTLNEELAPKVGVSHD